MIGTRKEMGLYQLIILLATFINGKALLPWTWLIKKQEIHANEEKKREFQVFGIVKCLGRVKYGGNK